MTATLPKVGIGLRVPHYRDVLERRPAVDFLEIHAENYLARSGWDWHVLSTLRRDCPISLHGVGLGLGSVHGFSNEHLERVRRLADALEPMLVSEHLSWGALADRQLNDLLPLRLDETALALVAERVARVQDALGRRLLIENLSTYLRFRGDVLSEADFLAGLVRRTGCGVLLDVNNLYVNQCNHGEDAFAAIEALPLGSVGEIHLGGHLVTPDGLIDHHGDRVAPPVWEVYRAALARFGAMPTLIEWDTDIPALDVLLEEVELARRVAAQVDQRPSDTDRRQIPLPAFAAPVVAEHPPAADLQQWFGAALFDPREAARLDPWLRGDPARLGVYRGNLRAAWSRALASSYPVLRQLVGEDAFDDLARAYGRAHPSRDPDLNRFGNHLPDFLDAHADDAGHPYLPDVATLEWLVHEAHYAPDAAVDLTALSAVDPEAFEASRAVLHPSLRLFASPWAAVALWRAHQPDGGAWPEDVAVPCHALVLRAGWRVHVIAIDAPEYAAVQRLAAGETIGMALDAACALDEAFDVQGAVERWLRNGLVVGLNGQA